LNRTSIVQEITGRIDKGDCIKLKSFSTAKKAISRIMRPPTELAKTFARYSSKI
jgi:hypothetical protein